MHQSLQAYWQEVEQIYNTHQATEHSYRPALQKLIESLAGNIRAINEPKRIACGAPDFLIKQNELEIGHIEAKDIGISLSKVVATEQLNRYFHALNNLIVTDHLEFRWYVDGEHRLTACLATIDKKKKLVADRSGILEVEQLLEQFLLTKAIQVNTPKVLAKRMAALAQLIRDAIKAALNSEDQGGMLRQQFESFQKVLIRDLTSEQFADMYAQTIAYGLFAARCSTDSPSEFSRKTAAYDLPKTNPFLRSIFSQIAGIDLDERIAWAVDTLANILKQTDMAEILKDFGKRTRQSDPVVHFYETFLAEYDAKMRESRGVYYTPEPVVSYIVRSVDYVLKHKFKIAKGLADAKKISIPKGEGTIETHQVLILDPAVGTGTFMYAVIDHIYESFKNQKGMWSGYVSQHLLPRLFGFELLMAPYTVAHMKLGLQLQQLGYDFSSEERLRIYLTNTLQEAFQIPAADGFMNRIRDEAEAARDVKQDTPVMVILGNPPYSYQSMNTDPWIVSLVKDYYQVDGKPLGERNPKGLLDDYVKFIRFAQHRISETGYGVMALITNHGYLDNPTFRGMRQSLMKTFDEIYVLDLHGNSKKKEVCPDGSPDKNVFDIQQGVAIGIFIKYQNSQQDVATVYHADLWGAREVYDNKQLVGGKYHWLAENDISSTQWQTIKPSIPFYIFKDQNGYISDEYQKFWKITDIMPNHVYGFKTHRDHFAIDLQKNIIADRINELVSFKKLDYSFLDKYDLKNFNIGIAATALQNQDLEKFIDLCSYRPLDNRFMFYSEYVMDRIRPELRKHLFRKDNLCLICSRQISTNDYKHVFVTDLVPNDCLISNITKESNHNFPLYLYPTDTILQESEYTTRSPNLAPEFITEFSQKLNLQFLTDGKGDQIKTFAPEDIFNYIYAVFHSPQYRSRYAEFLKIDFPRVPLTSDVKLFWELANLGERLVQLHLMKETGSEICSYPISGSNIVEQVKYDETNQRVYINKVQYFEPVPTAIWNFYIGGYQVCQKWLKDRKNRELTYDDLSHYQNIISILGETIEKMDRIDQIIESYGGFPLG
ncbi:putative helicase [Synechococcus sp. PCC 7502]|uniref:type ISP restriction/modification enzyme n=1 Tax=Synechococcus sp. PCC 7502 TaxID=1173263 RepID=UPI00029FF022|nr:type ISP restriction/modification enzyme [Synechococcus sp. PCC 7502]AFY75368.1 putative helicase [Synechococcus sp. PCC 7502]